jgi:hypothetical protein
MAPTPGRIDQELPATQTTPTGATQRTPPSSRGRPGSTPTTRLPTGTMDGAPEELAGEGDVLGAGDPTEERDMASVELEPPGSAAPPKRAQQLALLS